MLTRAGCARVRYHDTGNVLLYGGIKFFDGMERTADDNLIVYPKASHPHAASTRPQAHHSRLLAGLRLFVGVRQGCCAMHGR